MGMEKYAKTIIPTIEANYERYTETERHIADYFLKNDAIGDLSAEFISTELSVSPASLSRFAKKSGYQGYREFGENHSGTGRVAAGLRHVSEPVE